LVIHGEIQKNLQKSTLAFNGDETQKTINFGGKLNFILSSLFHGRLHCSYLYNYYN
jgi:hypothetical protein